MPTIGVAELRQNASKVLRRVEAGETFAVTDRGRPVAVLSPYTADDPLERLRAAGEVDSATGSIDALPSPAPLEPGEESPSGVLTRARQQER